MKCLYCKNEATRTISFDIDLPKIYLCENEICYYKLLYNLQKWTTKKN